VLIAHNVPQLNEVADYTSKIIVSLAFVANGFGLGEVAEPNVELKNKT